MTQINWQYQVNNRAGGYVVTNTDWNDFAANFRAFVDQTTGSGTTDNVALPIGIDLVNHKVFISDPTSTVACAPEAANNTASAQLQISANSEDATFAISTAHDTEATTSVIQLRKADGSQASPALVDDDAVLGKIMFQGYDGNSWANGAQIRAQINGTPADGDMPTEMIFMVTPDGGSETPATALTISPNKNATFQGAVFATAKMQTGQSAYTQEPWSNSTIALGNFGSIGTQGSYRTAWCWNWERGTDDNYHHLDVNSYPQAGYIEIGHGGINFGWEADYENNHTDAPTKVLQMNADALFPTTTDVTDLGTSSYKYAIVYGNYFYATGGSSTYPAYIFDTDNNTGMYLDGSLNLGFSTNTVRKLVITPAGQFGFRDDAAAGTLPNRLANFRTQTSGMTGLVVWAEYDVDAASGTALICMLGDSGDSSNPSTDDYFILFRRGNGTTIGNIRGTGSASVTYNTTSDQTMKNDLGDAGDLGPLIDAIKIHKYTWKDADAKVGEQFGVFAQEVLDISGMPNGIASPAETRNEVVDIITDEDGNEVEKKEDVYYPAGIDYGKLVPLLVQEIKSLRVRVAALES